MGIFLLRDLKIPMGHKRLSKRKGETYKTKAALLKLIFINYPNIFKWGYLYKISWLRLAKECHVKNNDFLFLEKGICVSKWLLCPFVRRSSLEKEASQVSPD